MSFLYNLGRHYILPEILTSTNKNTKKSLLILASLFFILLQSNTDVYAAPVVTPSGSPTIDEGGTLTLIPVATFTNIDTTLSHTSDIWWGDGTGIDTGTVVEVVGSGTGSINASHIYDDDGLSGSYMSTVCVIDSNLGSHCQPFTITVNNVAPVIQGTPLINPTAANEGSLTTLATFDFTDPSTVDDYTVTIDWGDSGANTIIAIASGTTPFTVPAQTHTYSDDAAGSFTITITVDDNDGGTDSTTVSAAVNNVAPIISGTPLINPATADEGSITTLTSFDFTDPSTVDAYTVTIDWGDSGANTIIAIASGTTPFTVPAQTHTYADNKLSPFTIGITVDDNDGDSDFTSVSATVNNTAPQVAAGINQSVGEGVSLVLNDVTFTDAGSPDTHGAVINWGDGTADTTIAAPTATSPIAGQNHTYADNGSYNVVITVTDDDSVNSSSADTVVVTVSNTAPSVVADIDQFGDEGATFILNAVDFTDDGALDTHTVSINWGDGVTTTPPDTLTPISGKTHTYVDNGIYNIQITVTDNDGSAGSDIVIADISNINAVVIDPVSYPVFTEGVTSSPATIARFTDVGISDTHNASIDWGDLTPLDNTNSVFDASGLVQDTHYYAMQGMYTIKTTVFDDGESGSGSNSYTITVGNSQPVLSVPGPQPATEGAVVNVTGISYIDYGGDAGSGDLHTVTIDWGDGMVVGPMTTGIDQDLNTITGSHTYTDDGTYFMLVTVTDDQALDSVQKSITINVSNDAPVVTNSGTFNFSVDVGQTASLLGVDFTDAGIDDTHNAQIDWNDGNGFVPAAAVINTGGSTNSIVHLGTSTAYTVSGDTIVTFSITDALDSSSITTETFTLTVNNLAPVVSAVSVSSTTINEASSISLAPTSFTDSGVGETHTATIDWGDGSLVASTTIDQGTDQVFAQYTYPEDSAGGTFTITVIVTDDGGLGHFNTVDVTVNNVAPTVTALIDSASIDEGDMVSLTPSTFDDVGLLDTHTFTVDWGDGTPVGPATTFGLDQVAETLTGMHTYVDQGTYGITVTVFDDYGDSGSDITTIVVANVKPVEGTNSFTFDEDSGANGLAITATDVGLNDTLVYTILTTTAGGSLTGTAPNTLTYTPNLDFNGIDIFTFSVFDGVDILSPVTGTIDVTPINDPPIASASPVNISTYLNVPGATTIDHGDVDMSDIPLTQTISYVPTTPGSGIVTIDQNNGLVTYTPNTGFTGVDSFDVLVSDSSSGSDTISIDVFVFGADIENPNDGIFTPTANNGSIDLTWQETFEEDLFAGVAFSDDLSGINYYTIASISTTGSTPEPAPADCTGGVTVYSVVSAIDSIHTYTYTDGSLINGNTYTYRICATDVSGNISTGVTTSAKPTVATFGFTTATSDIGLSGIERVDGGTDSNNYSGGKPQVDMEYTFSIVFKSTTNPTSVNVNISSRADGSLPTTYQLTCTGQFTDGALCTFTTPLGPAADYQFYFDAPGTALRYPSSGFLTGPTVSMLNIYAMVGVPRDIDSAGLNGSGAFDTIYSYRWISTNLSTGVNNFGYYEAIDTSTNKARTGEGYYVRATLGSSLKSFDAYADSPELTSENITLSPGWNIISNPYNGNVNLKDLTIGGVPWETAATDGVVYNTIYYYNGWDWGSTYMAETTGSVPEAKLVPWLGYWIYVKSSTGITLTIPKP